MGIKIFAKSPFFSGQKGSVTILIAVAMLVFTGFTALVTDAGIIYLNHAKMNNALDSAVLAGVQELPDDQGEALQQAKLYAGRNGISYEELDLQVENENTAISATASREVQLLFARTLGFKSTRVKGHSKARIVPISVSRGTAPFGVLEGDYQFGEEVTLKEGTGEEPQHGWFGALSLGGSGASIYKKNLKFGYPGRLAVGDLVSTESGNMSGPTSEGLAYRINCCHHVPQCSINCFASGCSRILIVPIVRAVSQNPGDHTFTVRIVGFGAFLVDSFVGNGSYNLVRGAFIRYVNAGETGSGVPDFGLYTAQLCE